MGDKIRVACIIDDDNVYVSLVKRIIEAKQLCQDLLIFENGKVALSYFQKISEDLEEEDIPEIIFLDLDMPVMDGWQFLERFISIKNKFGKIITVYIVSSSINPIDINRAKKMRGIKDYLIKPVTIGDLESIFSPA